MVSLSLSLFSQMQLLGGRRKGAGAHQRHQPAGRQAHRQRTGTRTKDPSRAYMIFAVLYPHRWGGGHCRRPIMEHTLRKSSPLRIVVTACVPPVSFPIHFTEFIMKINGASSHGKVDGKPQKYSPSSPTGADHQVRAASAVKTRLVHGAHRTSALRAVPRS